MIATDTDTLAGLDFKPTIPCEGTGHEKVHIRRGEAIWTQHALCPNCQHASTLDICEGGRQYRLLCDRIHCTTCQKTAPFDEWGFKFEPIDRRF